METARVLSANWFLVALLIINALSGWLIPEFYDWTGADQSRPTLWVWLVPLVGLLLSQLYFIGSLWLKITGWNTHGFKPLSIKQLLLATSIAAIVTACVRYSHIALSLGIYALVIVELVRSIVRQSDRVWPTIALLGCMLLPLCWVLKAPGIQMFRPEMLLALVSGPSMIEAGLLGFLLGANNMQNILPIGILFTAIQLLGGRYFIATSTKGTILYMMLLSIHAWVGSMVLHMLYRM